MRGASVIISHAIYFAIGMAVLSLLLGTFIYATENWKSSTQREEAQAILSSLKAQITDLYTDAFSDGIVERRLVLKDTIGNEKYRIEFENKTIKLVLGAQRFETNITEDLNLTGTGYSDGKLIYNISNKTVEIR
jgi:hypothetical protein